MPNDSQPDTQPDQSQQATVGPEALLNAIDFEIESARRTTERPGWSPWAFAAAIGAVAWALIDELVSGDFGSRAGWPLAIYMLVLADALRLLWRSWGSPRPENARPRFFRGANDVRRTRPDLLFTVTLWVLYFVVHVTADRVVGPIAWWAATTILGFLVLLCLFLLVLLFTNLPIPQDSSTPVRIARGVGIGSIGAVLGAAVLVMLAVASTGEEGRASLKGVFLIVGLVALIDGFLRQPERVHLISDLENLRRAMMYDRLESAEAARQLRVLVRGADVSDLVFGEAMACLRSIDFAVARANTCVERLRAIEELLGRSNGPLDPAERSIVDACGEEQRRLIDEVSAARRAAGQEYARIKRRWSQVGRLSQPEVQIVASVENLLLSRDRIIDDVEAERKAIAARVLALLQKRDEAQAPSS